MVNVPSGYDTLLQQMSQATGIPYAVEAAQAQAESGFKSTAVSPTGAEGWLQFEPGTYQTYAQQAGVDPTSEFDPASEAKVYDVFMGQLLQQYKGNLRDALAAYNAGPGNLSAGYGYADQIMAAAGQKPTTNVPSSNAQTAGFSLSNPLGGISVSGVITDAINAVLKAMGLGSVKDLMERAGLLILGFVLVIVGIKILSGGTSSSSTTTTTKETSDNSETSSSFNKPSGKEEETRTVKHEPVKAAGDATKSVGADEAMEAAAVA